MAKPVLCALVAIEPSTLSAAMHNAGFRELKLPYCYVAFDTKETTEALEAMRVLGIRGYSLSIPHKEKALLGVDQVSEQAKVIGAINTVINDGEQLIGENTDWYGVLEALREVQFKPTTSSCLVIGAGGAARAAIYALEHIGVENITVANRSVEKAKQLATTFNVDAISFEDLKETNFDGLDLLINTTPIGSSRVSKSVSFPFDLELLSAPQIVFDMVTEDTELITKASELGTKVVPGVRMLLHQAVKQFELFTGLAAPIEVMEEALRREMQ